MLAKIMKLPLRKDAVRNVFEDIRQSGKQPTLQIYGQIAAAAGTARQLHLPLPHRHTTTYSSDCLRRHSSLRQESLGFS